MWALARRLLQVLPHLQAQAASVNVFCRSMTYCHPFINITYPNWIKWAFRWIPGLLALYASVVGSLFGVWAYFVFRPETWLARFEERHCRHILKKQVSDPVLLKQLTPTGRFGSKRPLVSLSGFLEVLQKENVNVITSPITGIDASGVITKASHTQDTVVQIGCGGAYSDSTSQSPEDEGIHIRPMYSFGVQASRCKDGEERCIPSGVPARCSLSIGKSILRHCMVSILTFLRPVRSEKSLVTALFHEN